MNTKAITEQEVYAAIGKRLVGELHDGIPEDVCWWGQKDEPVWHAYVDSGNCIGASRLIIISKTTGKIIGDQMVGE